MTTKFLLIFPATGYVRRFVGRKPMELAHVDEPERLVEMKESLEWFRLFGDVKPHLPGRPPSGGGTPQAARAA